MINSSFDNELGFTPLKQGVKLTYTRGNKQV